MTKYIEKSGIRDIVIASTSVVTALEFAKAFRNEARIICVSDEPYRKEMNFECPCMNEKIKERLESLGVIVFDKAPYALHGSLYGHSDCNPPAPEMLSGTRCIHLVRA